MKNNKSEVEKLFKFHKVLIPVLIGFAVPVILLSREYNPDTFRTIIWSPHTFLISILILVLIVTRQLAYMYRIRVLTDNQLTFKRSFFVILLWEFASTVTPTTVGGTAVAFYIMKKEGIKMGKTTAVVLTTAMLDEMFFVISIPIMFLILSGHDVLPGGNQLFILGLSLKIMLAFGLIYGVFVNPTGLKKLFIWVASFFKKINLKEKAVETGDDLIITSKLMSGKPFLFWIKVYTATFIAWGSKFLIVNAILLLVTQLSFYDHIIIFTRQFSVWIIMLFGITPGASGFAEVGFQYNINDFASGMMPAALAFFWRLITYYPYLIAGIFVLPFWFRYIKKSKSKLV